MCTDVPVFPTVTAMVTLDKYEPCTTAAEVFRIPEDYVKVHNMYIFLVKRIQ